VGRAAGGLPALLIAAGGRHGMQLDYPCGGRGSELVVLIGGEEVGYVAQAFGEAGAAMSGSRAREDRGSRSPRPSTAYLNGQRVREGRLEEALRARSRCSLGSLAAKRLVVLGAAAGLPGILAGFAADLCLGLRQMSAEKLSGTPALSTKLWPR